MNAGITDPEVRKKKLNAEPRGMWGGRGAHSFFGRAGCLNEVYSTV